MEPVRQYTFMTRQELALAAGVSVKTLSVYIKGIWPQLESMGCRPYCRLTPIAVKYICENYGISF